MIDKLGHTVYEQQYKAFNKLIIRNRRNKFQINLMLHLINKNSQMIMIT